MWGPAWLVLRTLLPAKILLVETFVKYDIEEISNKSITTQTYWKGIEGKLVKALFHCRHSAYTRIDFSLKSGFIWPTQELFIVLNQDSRKSAYTGFDFSLKSGFKKILPTPVFHLP